MLSSVFLAVFLLADVAAASSAANFTFNGFVGAKLSLGASAKITDVGLLQLTNDSQQVQSHAFFPFPLRFKDSAGDGGGPLPFSTTFVFAIVPEHPDASGHGFTFSLCPSEDLPGALPSQSLGLFNTTSDMGDAKHHIFAVEFDTVKTVEYKDIDNNHVGIDANSLISKNSSPMAYFDDGDRAWKNLTLISGEPMQVWVDYSGGGDMQLDVVVARLYAPKPKIPLVSLKINLSSIVLDEMFVGFTASTGSATESHYISGWSFCLNGSALPLNLSNLPPFPRTHISKKKSEVLPAALPLAAVIVLLVSAAAVIHVRRRRKKFAELTEDWEQQYGPQRISYRDLYRATKGFSDANLLGTGGFGRVYRGVLPASGAEIAVKKISHESKQGMREFVAEIASMGRLRHRNLVQLLGYCRRQGELLLVYEYMSNGSLDRFIFGGGRPALGWPERFQVIKGVAGGLLYLHEGWEQVVIHRDIKASNILLDSEFNGKLSDFGLARLYDHGTNPHTTHVVGTIGYLAPELSSTGKATKDTDVYAFGAFLLEVACGRRPIEVDSPPAAAAATPGLVGFVLECWKRGRILEAMDAKLRDGGGAEKEVETVLKLGLLCSHPDPAARPSMRQVVQFLEAGASLPPMSPDALMRSVSDLRYDGAFDEFLTSFPSSSDVLLAQHSSPLFSGGR